MKVYRGTQGGRPCRWVEPRTAWQLNLTEMVDGLCSKYARNRVEDWEEPLPESLSLKTVMDAVRGEYMRYGTNATWTWSDGMGEGVEKRYRQWAKGIILDVLPELGEP